MRPPCLPGIIIVLEAVIILYTRTQPAAHPHPLWVLPFDQYLTNQIFNLLSFYVLRARSSAAEHAAHTYPQWV